MKESTWKAIPYTETQFSGSNGWSVGVISRLLFTIQSRSWGRSGKVGRGRPKEISRKDLSRQPRPEPSLATQGLNAVPKNILFFSPSSPFQYIVL